MSLGENGAADRGLRLSRQVAGAVCGVWLLLTLEVWPAAAIGAGAMIVLAAVWDFRYLHKRSGSWVAPQPRSRDTDGSWVASTRCGAMINDEDRSAACATLPPTHGRATWPPRSPLWIVLELATYTAVLLTLFWTL